MPKRIDKAGRANAIIRALKNFDGWVSTPELCRATGFTVGQIKAAVQWARRYFRDNPKNREKYYIVSGPKGYKLPKTTEDLLDVYKSLYSWAMSVLVTLKPISDELTAKGYDMQAVREEIKKEATEQEEVGGKSAWRD